MNIQEALDWRYAVREFSSKKLTALQLNNLLEATRKSASSYGLQPYKILVIESEAIRQSLLPYSYGQQKVVDCSHLVVFAALSNIGDGIVDRYIKQLIKIRDVSYESVAQYANHMKNALASKSDAQKRIWAHQQAYIALGTFLTSAAVLKIDTCPMTGIDAQGYDTSLGLSEQGLETVAIAAVGFRSSGDHHAVLPKVRFDFDELISTV